jgi:hypothetical protein
MSSAPRRAPARARARARMLPAFALLSAFTPRAQAQDAADQAYERADAVNFMRAGIVRPAAALALRLDAPSGVSDLAGAPALGFVLAAMEKKGAAWEALRLEPLRYWIEGGVDVGVTVFDLQAAMIGHDTDGDLCLASITVFFHGDCTTGGVLGMRAQLLQHQHQGDSGRWFHRYFELGPLLNFVGDSFDSDFIELRLPLLFGVSLDHVANIALPAGEHALMLRGVAGADLVFRPSNFRSELAISLRYRPSLTPLALSDDYGLEASARVGYMWLAELTSIRPNVQRAFLEARFTHWERPYRADRFSAMLAQNAFELVLGFELTLSNVTPS